LGNTNHGGRLDAEIKQHFNANTFTSVKSEKEILMETILVSKYVNKTYAYSWSMILEYFMIVNMEYLWLTKSIAVSYVMYSTSKTHLFMLNFEHQIRDDMIAYFGISRIILLKKESEDHSWTISVTSKETAPILKF
jgi:hypothetical protein